MPNEIRFSGEIEYFDPASEKGLAVIDIPREHVAVLGGLKQFRVTGTLNATPFTGSTMARKGGRFCVAVSKAAMASAGLRVGDPAQVTLARA